MTVTTLDPTKDPTIWVGMLSDRRDLLRLRKGVRHLFELAQSQSMRELTEAEPMLAPRTMPGRPDFRLSRMMPR